MGSIHASIFSIQGVKSMDYDTIIREGFGIGGDDEETETEMD